MLEQSRILSGQSSPTTPTSRTVVKKLAAKEKNTREPPKFSPRFRRGFDRIHGHGSNHSSNGIENPF